jgi:hypothetical protein
MVQTFLLAFTAFCWTPYFHEHSSTPHAQLNLFFRMSRFTRVLVTVHSDVGSVEHDWFVNHGYHIASSNDLSIHIAVPMQRFLEKLRNVV